MHVCDPTSMSIWAATQQGQHLTDFATYYYHVSSSTPHRSPAICEWHIEMHCLPDREPSQIASLVRRGQGRRGGWGQVVQALHAKPQPASSIQICQTSVPTSWYRTFNCVVQRWRGARRHRGRQHSAAARLRSSWLRHAKLRLMRMRGTFNWNTPSPSRSVAMPPPAWVFGSARLTDSYSIQVYLQQDNPQVPMVTVKQQAAMLRTVLDCCVLVAGRSGMQARQIHSLTATSCVCILPSLP